jgi:phospholipase/lecithinase/hemolysin
MNRFRLAVSAAFLAAWLAGCGGGDPDVPGSGSPSGAPTTKGEFTSIVSFGDSLSDVGTYRPATSVTGNGNAPFFAGKFTTDTAVDSVIATGAPIWLENLAGSLGLMVTPAEVGFGTSSVACPAAAVPALASTCTAYGQGGARITDPNGIGKAGGALTVPVVTQIANHLARFGSFKSSDLIFVWAGNNDVFVQFGTFAAKAAQIQADAQAGTLTPDQANVALFSAQTEAQAAMKQAALELAGYIRTEILGKGGTYVAVANLPDIADTPFGQQPQLGDARQVLTDLSRLFNLWLADGLTGQPVRLIDTFGLYKKITADPASFGFANATIPACDPAKINALTSGAITDGSSLFCNADAGAPYFGLRTGADAQTWLFADGVHPTTGGHKAISDAFAAELASFGWL